MRRNLSWAHASVTALDLLQTLRLEITERFARLCSKVTGPSDESKPRLRIYS
jgi:hypothetical protein